jgi:enamine deaminase RidA (YjgF/YER057c/UK114 family)
VSRIASSFAVAVIPTEGRDLDSVVPAPESGNFTARCLVALGMTAISCFPDNRSDQISSSKTAKPMRTLQPEGWAAPKGFSNGIAAEGRFVFVAGQVGADPVTGAVAEGFVAQARQALENIAAVLKSGGAGPEHLTRLTWYVTDMDAYLGHLKPLGRAYREVIGEHFPVMALVGVTALVIPGAVVEIEATAVVPK